MMERKGLAALARVTSFAIRVPTGFAHVKQIPKIIHINNLRIVSWYPSSTHAAPNPGRCHSISRLAETFPTAASRPKT